MACYRFDRVFIALIPVDYDDRFEAAIKSAAGDDLEIIKNEIKSGECVAFSFCGSNYDFKVVLRVEKVADKNELVLVLGAGHGMKYAIKDLLHFAKINKCHTIRTHVKSRGLVKIWESLGFEIKETVLSYGRQIQE